MLIHLTLAVLATSLSAAQAQDQVVNAAPNRCQSVYGNTCQFPFTYRGQLYEQCTYTETTDGKPWCATQLRRDGITAMPGSYENCDEALCFIQPCDVTDGPARGSVCKFPFTFQGRTYTQCAEWRWGGRYSGTNWCSTRTDSRGNHINGQGNWGICDCYGSSTCGCTPVVYNDNRPAFAAAAPPSSDDSFADSPAADEAFDSFGADVPL